MKRLTLFLFVMIFIINCAGSMGGKGDKYKSGLGLVTTSDFTEKTERILQKYQYQILRNEQSSSELYIETDWKDHLPYDDEQEQLIVASRTRIIIRARPRSTTATQKGRAEEGASYEDALRAEQEKETGIAGVNTAEFSSEYMVQVEENPEWQRLKMSKSVQDHLKRIASELKMEFAAGARGF